jgi:hypothetical protein
MKIEEARAWRDAAVADGWSIRPTYDGHEDVSRAATLEKDGWTALIVTRVYDEEYMKTAAPWLKSMAGKTDVSIAVWGPDTLAISVPMPYSFDSCIKMLRRCNDCKKEDVSTQRVSFAGRVCSTCLPAARKRDEYPGWTN